MVLDFFHFGMTIRPGGLSFFFVGMTTVIVVINNGY